MLYTSRILDRLGYEEKDQKFIKKFVQDYENNFRYVRRWAWKRNVPTDVASFFVVVKKDELLRIKRLEKAINNEATFFFIQVQEDGFNVIRK